MKRTYVLLALLLCISSWGCSSKQGQDAVGPLSKFSGEVDPPSVPEDTLIFLHGYTVLTTINNYDHFIQYGIKRDGITVSSKTFAESVYGEDFYKEVGDYLDSALVLRILNDACADYDSLPGCP